MDNFIKLLSDYAHGDLTRSANSPDAQTAILARVALNPGKFAQNALGDAGNVVKSVLGTPAAVFNSVKNGTEAKDLQNLGGSVVDQYKDIATDPYGSFVNHPVATSLALAPAEKVLSPGVSEAAAATTQPTNWASEGMKVAQDAKKSQGLPSIPGMNLVKKTPEEIATSQVPDVDPYDAQKFNNQFIVPTKRAGKNDLNTLDTSTKILQHVKSGMQVDPKVAPELVTGDNGLTTQMTRDYYSQIQGGNVNMNSPVAAAQDILGKSAALTDADEARALTAIKRTLPDASAAPEDIYDKARELQTLGWEYKRKSTYLTDSMKSEHLGDAYLAAGNDILDQLDTAAAKTGVMDSVKTPERIAQAEQISPLYAKQLAAAKTGPDLRATAAPFVKLQKMIELDQDSKNSTFGKVAKGMEQGINIGGGNQINATDMINHPIQSLQNTAGNAVGSYIDKKLAPVYENINRKSMGNTNSFLPQAAQVAMDPNVQAAASAGLKFAGNAGKAALPKVLSTGLASIGAVNTPSIFSADQPLPSKPGDIKDASKFVPAPMYPDQVPDQSGHYPLPTQSTASSTFMTEQQREQAEAGLSTNSQEYKKIEQKFAQDQEMAKAQYTPQVATFMKQAVPIQKNTNIIYDQIGDGTIPLNILHQFDNLNDAVKKVDPQYQGAVTALDGLNKNFANLYKSVTGEDPSENMLISTKDFAPQAQAKIGYMTNFFAGTYGRYKDAYSAVTSPAGTLSPNGQPVAAPAVAPQNRSGINPDMVQGNFGLPAIGAVQ